MQACALAEEEGYLAQGQKMIKWWKRKNDITVKYKKVKARYEELSEEVQRDFYGSCRRVVRKNIGKGAEHQGI